MLFEPALEIHCLLVVNVGQRPDLHPRILHKAAANDRSAATQADHPQADTIVGARNGSVGPRIHAARGHCGGCCSSQKKRTAVHWENASFIALNAGAITFSPPCEWSARSSSFSTHPFQPIRLMVEATS